MNYTNSEPYDFPPSLLPDPSSPQWMNKGDNFWQLTATTMVGLQSVPGLVLLYGSMVNRKWAVNSSFMALYAFSMVLLCWVLWAHSMSFGPNRLGPLVGVPGCALTQNYLLQQSRYGYVPMVDFVYYEFVFAAITVILLAGSLLGRMNFYAWMLFVPLWLTFSYTVGAFSVWGNGFLKPYIIDYAGGFVIHLSSGVAGFTAAYWIVVVVLGLAYLANESNGTGHLGFGWLLLHFIKLLQIQVGPRKSIDRQHFPPNNIIHVLGGSGFLWLGWSGFNGGSPFAANLITSLAILNTHLCTATSLFVWVSMDLILYKKSSVIGAVQGMITGLVCITPGAGVVEPWAAIIMDALSGSLPWYTMMVLHKRLAFFQRVDDTLGVFHTHAIAGILGGLLSGMFAKPKLLKMIYPFAKYGPGLLYSYSAGKLTHGLRQMGYQLVGTIFITAWNVVVTSLICLLISRIINLRMNDEDLKIGDDAVHGEEAYALWGDGVTMPTSLRWHLTPRFPSVCLWHSRE